MAQSTVLRVIGSVLAAIAAAAIPLGLQLGGRITPFQADMLVIGGIVSLVVAGVLWRVSRRLRHTEKAILALSIPTLLADMDMRREHIIRNELNKRMGSSDVDFVLDIIRHFYAVLVGERLPELPPRGGDTDDDVLESLQSLFEFVPTAVEGIRKMQEPMARRGEKETGLVVARSVNEYLSIDDKVENDRSYKRLKRNLKRAREQLRGTIACNATSAIDNYLDSSRAYKAPIIVILPLIRMLRENELLGDEPFAKQIIDIFQSYPEQYTKILNNSLAKVNGALGEYARHAP